MGAALARQVAASFLTTRPPGASEPQIATQDDPRLTPASPQPSPGWRRGSTRPNPAAETASAVGLSPAGWNALPRGAGDNPRAHALDLRLQAARRMLTDTKHPLAEVALRTGFSSPATSVPRLPQELKIP
jgi:transcriptional regulator GlxA family with amidase domain